MHVGRNEVAQVACRNRANAPSNGGFVSSPTCSTGCLPRTTHSCVRTARTTKSPSSLDHHVSYTRALYGKLLFSLLTRVGTPFRTSTVRKRTTPTRRNVGSQRASVALFEARSHGVEPASSGHGASAWRLESFEHERQSESSCLRSPASVVTVRRSSSGPAPVDHQCLSSNRPSAETAWC